MSETAIDVQVQEDGPCRRTLNIKIPAARIREMLEGYFADAAKHVNLKGFRSGKIPRAVLEKKFGEEIRSQAKERALQESFQEACRENDIDFVGSPDVEDIPEGPLSETEDLGYTVRVNLRPQIELADVAAIEVKAEATDVTDEDLEHALGQIADQKKTLDTIDEPVAAGDFFKSQMVWKNEAGESVLEHQDKQLNTNIPLAGVAPEEFQNQLVGKSKGESVVLDATFPETFEIEDVRGQKGQVEITVQEVLRVQAPPVDDELAKSFDFDTVDALKEELTKRIGDEKQRAEHIRQEEAILEAMLLENPFDIPDALVDDQTNGMLHEFEERLKQQGLEESEIQTKLDEARPEAMQNARRNVQMFFLIEAVAMQQQMQISQNELELELHKVAAQNGVPVDEVRDHMEKNRLLGDFQMRILERKVRDYLRETAKISDNTGES